MYFNVYVWRFNVFDFKIIRYSLLVYISLHIY